MDSHTSLTKMKLNLNEVSNYYEEKLRSYGACFKGVDWSSEESQILRFEQLEKVIGKDKNFSLIDYGCGYGSFLKFLLTKYKTFHYSGFDISKEMLKTAKEQNVKKNAMWVFNEKTLLPVDYVIASGVFNVKLSFSAEDWLQYVLETLQLFNRLSLKGFSFNVLSSYSDNEYRKEHLFYADPLFFFNHCKRNFARNVSLLHDYHLFEFTLLVKKQ